jgi:ParB family transcriptional regulator, chromosome partitioning protein
MSANGQQLKPVQGVDISIVKLIPRNERKVAKKYRQRIEASMRAVGLIEPLIVFPLGDGYEILDGALRYRILLDMGVERYPVWFTTRDGFTGNRMVNQLSASQEMRMLRKSLEELDEKTIANALGMQGIGHRLNKGCSKSCTRRWSRLLMPTRSSCRRLASWSTSSPNDSTKSCS